MGQTIEPNGELAPAGAWACSARGQWYCWPSHPPERAQRRAEALAGAPAVLSPRAVGVLSVLPQRSAVQQMGPRGGGGPGQLSAGGRHEWSVQKAWLKGSHSLQRGGLAIPGAPGPASWDVSVSILLV